MRPAHRTNKYIRKPTPRGCMWWFAAAAVNSAGLSSIAVGQSTNWTFNGPLGTWSTASNWNNGVPISSIDANFNLNNTYTVTWNANAAASNVNITTGTVTLDSNNYTLNAAGIITLGPSGALIFNDGTLSTGSLDVSNGKAFSFTGGTININGGTYKPKLGTLAINFRPTSFDIVDGMEINGLSTSTLSLRSGGTLTSEDAYLYIGHSGKSGYVGIDGAHSALSSSRLSIGTGRDASGMFAGAGTLNLSNGGNASSSFRANIGESGGRGFVTVNGSNSKLFSTDDDLFIGFSGFPSGSTFYPAEGTLLITGGGQVESYYSTNIGLVGARGFVSVDGRNSKLSATNSELSIGASGNDSVGSIYFAEGTLSISNGGQANSYSNINIGRGGAKGFVNVDGADSELSSTNGQIVLAYGAGEYGNTVVPSEGTLCIANGGQAKSYFPTYIGTSGGKGFLSVDGLNSKLSVNSFLIVGDNGYLIRDTLTPSEGTMNIATGGQVSVGKRLYVGLESANGYINMSTGTMTILAELCVGWNQLFSGPSLPSNGIVVLMDGSSMTSDGAVAGIAGGNGTISLNGDGTRWTNAKDVYLGNDGSGYAGSNGNGSLIVSNGAALTNGQTLKVYSGGQVTLASGASISTGTLDLTGSASRLTWTGGRLSINSFAPAADGLLTVPSTGTLGGNGTIARPTQVSPGGNIAPGNSIGKLTFTDNVTFADATAELIMEISGTGGAPGAAGVDFDQLVITGAGRLLSLNGATLDLMPLSGIVTGQPYTLVSASDGASIAGIFTGLADEAATYTQNGTFFKIDYEPNYVNLTFTTIPEPTGLFALSAGAIALLARRYRRPN